MSCDLKILQILENPEALRRAMTACGLDFEDEAVRAELAAGMRAGAESHGPIRLDTPEEVRAFLAGMRFNWDDGGRVNGFCTVPRKR